MGLVNRDDDDDDDGVMGVAFGRDGLRGRQRERRGGIVPPSCGREM